MLQEARQSRCVTVIGEAKKKGCKLEANKEQKMVWLMKVEISGKCIEDCGQLNAGTLQFQYNTYVLNMLRELTPPRTVCCNRYGNT